MLQKILILFLVIGCTATKKEPSRSIASWHSCYETLSSIIYHSNKSYNYGLTGFQFATDLASVEQLYGDESFFLIQGRLSNAEIKKSNSKLRQLLAKKAQIDEADPSKVVRITEEQASTLYDDMERTPCVADDSAYQRAGVNLGYCFGRAIVSHFHGLRRGIHPQAMKKIWVVGPMHGDWGHHVAYMVRGNNGKWYVIDNVTGVVPHTEWMNQLKTFKNTDQELMFFVTEANRFGPESNTTYNTVDLFNVQNQNWSGFKKSSDYYRGFFRDFFHWLDKQPKPEQF